MFVLFSFVAFVTSSFPFPSLPSFLHSIYPFMHPYFHPLNTITMPCTFMHPYSHSYTSIFYSQLSAGCMYWRSTVGVRERATMLHLTQPPSNTTLHHTPHPHRPTPPSLLAVISNAQVQHDSDDTFDIPRSSAGGGLCLRFWVCGVVGPLSDYTICLQTAVVPGSGCALWLSP